MDPHFYAEFAQRIGHGVIEDNGRYWFEVSSRVWMCCPFEMRLNPASVDPSKIMDSRGVMARYCCEPENGVPSFRHIVNQRDYDLKTLNAKARNKTRQGLEYCRSGQLDASELQDAGIELHEKTLRRQGRRIPDNFEAWWRNYFEAVSKYPAATLWASWHEGSLAAFLVSFRIGSVENISIVRSDEELLKYKPNNAMLYTFLQDRMSNPDISEVCIGLQSLQPGMDSLDLFKRGMGFIEEPIGQRIELRPTLRMAMPQGIARLAGKAMGRFRNEHAARLAGALECYGTQPAIRRSA
ncbi:MAG: GNAT family N-acetyltransferase [Planctomycetaceae bacterium]|nr:GNAT family N-acetyltransferase [Planctomycetaceae bacterium]